MMDYQFLWKKPFRLHYSKVLNSNEFFTLFYHTLVIGPFQWRWYTVPEERAADALAAKDETIKRLSGENGSLTDFYIQELAAKDAEIAELRERFDSMALASDLHNAAVALGRRAALKEAIAITELHARGTTAQTRQNTCRDIALLLRSLINKEPQ